MTLGRCSCEFTFSYAVHPQTIRVWLADSPRLADSPQGVADRSADRLDRVAVFSVGEDFCTADSPRLFFRTVCPSLADSPRQLGGQSDLYAETCQV
jgi:hypothetical protein